MIHRKSKRKLSFADVVKAKGSPIKVKGYYKSSEKSHDASVSAQIAEVQVDPETGQVRLKQMVSAHTTGKVINPLMHQGQIDGGVVFGLGYALQEEILFDNGKSPDDQFRRIQNPQYHGHPAAKNFGYRECAAWPGTLQQSGDR